MAGGMRRRTGPSLGERIGTRRDGGRITPGRHCYVDEPPERSGSFPALLVEWRQDESGWAGLVAYVLPDVGRQAVLVQRWLPASHLRPRR